jgi:hypothetical protein
LDKAEAQKILDAEAAALRSRPYEELRALIKESEHKEVTSPSGKWYQIESLAVWDGKPEGDLRIMVSIDDGGLRAIVPMTRNVLVAPDGSFLDEN